MTSLPNYPNGKSYAISPGGLEHLAQNQQAAKFPRQNVIWTDDIRVELPVRVGTTGVAALPPSTLVNQWRINLEKYAKDPALSVKRNDKWTTLTYEEYYEESMRVAKSLLALNLTEFTGVNIIGFNAPEWSISFHGSVFARCIPVGIYSTNNTEICEYVARHSGTRVVIAENKQLAAKYFGLLESGEIEKIVLYNDTVGSNDFGGKIISWEAFLALGKKIGDEKVEERKGKIAPGQCCTLGYTSGTTGMPKGVMLSHDNATWTPKGQQSKAGSPILERSRAVSYLPLSHVAALYFDILLPLINGMHIFYAEPTALQGTLVQTLQEAKPNSFFAVPRVWEKIYTKIKQQESSSGAIAKGLISWAQGVGIEGTIQQKKGQETSWQFKLAKKLVFDKIKAALGFQQCGYFAYGAAPLDPTVRKYFLSMNFLLTNGYGMTETSAPHNSTEGPTYNPVEPSDYFEVGTPIPGCSTVIKQVEGSEVGDEGGQICMRGRNVMMGYLKNAQETSKTIDSEGFLHSGDLGKITKEGYLFITGRAKELIITAGGQNIPPVLIENEIKKVLPYLSNVMVVGEQKPYLNCLISLLEDPPMSGTLEKNTADYLASKDCPVKTIKEAAAHPNFKNVIMEGLKLANAKAISRAQTVQNFYLMPQDFSVENRCLTPSLKLKRKQALKKYSTEVRQMYESPKL